MTHTRPLRGAIALSLLLALSLAVAAPHQHRPPRVVASTVEDGQDDVDPALAEIRVTFDRPMNPTSWSFVGGGESFPELVGRPRWADERTIAINVKLRPDHEYWLSLNSDTFTGFRGRDGTPAVPQPIAFRTRPADAPASRPAVRTAEQNRAAIAALRRAIASEYAYRDRLGLDWDALFAEHGPAMESAATANAFGRAVARLLRNAEDGHVYVRAGDRVLGTHVNARPPNYNLAALPRLVPGWRQHAGGVASGTFGDGTGYLLIPAWNGAAAEGLEAAWPVVKDAPAVVIDVRPNGGGDETVARAFAARFAAAPAVYSRSRVRRDGAWHGPFDRAVEPRPADERYGGRVVVLIGPKVASSCESFVLMMRHGAGAALVGDTTKGSSGNPRPHDLGGGVTVFLSSWEDQLPDGAVLEGRGVTPDIAAAGASAGDRDPVLEAAVRLLAQHR